MNAGSATDGERQQPSPALDLTRRILTVWLAFGASANAHGLSAEAVQSLHAFLDKTAPALMEERHIPGAAIAVVHQGNVLYLRGFGSRSLESNAPVVPETAFRVGSVSKLFTAIAALKLAEAQTLDFHRNLNEYVPTLRLLAPTTMHQLLTHTAGFDERFAGAYTESSLIWTSTLS